LLISEAGDGVPLGALAPEPPDYMRADDAYLS
jgi:hypothetical protein